MIWLKYLLFKLWLTFQAQWQSPPPMEDPLQDNEVQEIQYGSVEKYYDYPPAPPPSPVDMKGFEGEDEWEYVR